MEWLNLHTSVLDSPEFIGEEPVNQATWIKLQRFCIGQENAGRIADCKRWKDRKWQQLVRVTKREVETKSALWDWIGDDLMVKFYPIEKQEIVRTKREIARENGTKGGRPKKPEPEPTLKPILVISEKAEGKGMEVEGNRKGSGTAPRLMACSENLERIRMAYPRHTHIPETLREIEAAVRRAGGDAAPVLEGVLAIAGAVKGWTENERIQFLKRPPEFFAGDHWRDDPAFWASKTAARKEHAGVRPDIPLDLGGRKPKAIRGVPAVATHANGNELEF